MVIEYFGPTIYPKRLIELGVQIICNKSISKVGRDTVDLSCKYTGKISSLETGNILFVTSRQPLNELYKSFSQDEITRHKHIKSIDIIGDANAPAPLHGLLMLVIIMRLTLIKQLMIILYHLNEK